MMQAETNTDAEQQRASYGAFISYSHVADGRLAVALQAALHRFAKPWYRLRAIRVFRDEASLSAAPALWDSIERALETSRWFVLLASPEAAESQWVNREVAWWLDRGREKRLLVVQTGGELAWRAEGGGVDRARSTALPPVAVERLGVEPRFVDLRWAATHDHLSLANPTFRDDVADVAAAIHERPKDELVGEDVRQHRRTRRIARAAIATLTLLLIAALVAAAAALQQRGEAINQRDRAEEQARIALSRQLAAESEAVREGQADLALLLAVAAWKFEDTAQARGALVRTLAASAGLGGLLGPQARPAFAVGFGQDGSIAVGGRRGVTLWDRQLRYVRALPLNSRTTALALSPKDGSISVGTRSGEVVVWDRSGRIVEMRRLGSEVTAVAFDDGGTLVGAGTGAGQVVLIPVGGESERRLSGGPFAPSALRVSSLGVVAGDPQGGVASWDLVVGGAPRVSNVGFGMIGASAFDRGLTRFAALALGQSQPYLVEVPSAREIHFPLTGPAINAFAMAFSTDGRTLATAEAGRIVFWDVRTGRALPDEMRGHPGLVNDVAFDAFGTAIAVAGEGGVTIWRRGGNSLLRVVRVKGAVASRELPRIVQGSASAAFSPSGDLVAWAVGDAIGREVVVWDLERDRLLKRVVGDRALAFVGPRALVVGSLDGDNAVHVDLTSGERRAASPLRRKEPLADRPWTVENGHGLGASAAVGGAVTLWDSLRRTPLATIEVPGGLDAAFLGFDPAGKRLAVAGVGGELALIDVDAGSWARSACSLARRELNATEWRNFVGEDQPRKTVCGDRAGSK